VLNLRNARAFSAGIIITLAIHAQASDPTSYVAPVPRAIAAARKVFISNAGADNLSRIVFSGAPNRCYNDFYRQVQALDRFEIVSNPAEADIVLEISLRFSEARVNNTIRQWLLRLRILDPKTQIVLWSFDASSEQGGIRATSDRNLDVAMNQIVSDLKALAGAPPSGER
jgi:hypothetical protein